MQNLRELADRFTKLADKVAGPNDSDNLAERFSRFASRIDPDAPADASELADRVANFADRVAGPSELTEAKKKLAAITSDVQDVLQMILAAEGEEEGEEETDEESDEEEEQSALLQALGKTEEEVATKAVSSIQTALDSNGKKLFPNAEFSDKKVEFPITKVKNPSAQDKPVATIRMELKKDNLLSGRILDAGGDIMEYKGTKVVTITDPANFWGVLSELASKMAETVEG